MSDSHVNLLNLPNEILLLICRSCYELKTSGLIYAEYVAPVHTPNFFCFAYRTVLYNLSLTTRRIRAVSLPVLFGNIYLRYSRIHNMKDSQYFSLFVAFTESIQHHKNARFIRALDCYMDRYDTQCIALLFAALPRLERAVVSVEVFLYAAVTTEKNILLEAMNRHASLRYLTVRPTQWHYDGISYPLHPSGFDPSCVVFREVDCTGESFSGASRHTPGVRTTMIEGDVSVLGEFDDIDATSPGLPWMKQTFDGLHELQIRHRFSERHHVASSEKALVHDFLARHPTVRVSLHPHEMDALPIPGVMNGSNALWGPVLNDCTIILTALQAVNHTDWYISAIQIMEQANSDFMEDRWWNPDRLALLSAAFPELEELNLIFTDCCGFSKVLPAFYNVLSQGFRALKRIEISIKDSPMDNHYNDGYARIREQEDLVIAQHLSAMMPSLTEATLKLSSYVDEKVFVYRFSRDVQSGKTGNTRVFEKLLLVPPEPDCVDTWETVLVSSD